MRLTAAASFSVRWSKAPSLKTGQSWRTSTKAVPRCSAAARRTSTSPCLSRSTVRATKVAPAPRASDSASSGGSIEPPGVDLVTLPNSLVGEAWPLVSP